MNDFANEWLVFYTSMFILIKQWFGVLMSGALLVKF